MNIINRIGAYDIGDGNMSDEMFDKKHAEFRIMTFISILKAKKDKYISMFRFTGDDELTNQKVKVMLKEAFTHGYAGMFDLTKAISNKLEGAVKGFFDENSESKKIPVGVAPSHWNEDDRVVKGHGFTTPRHNTGQKTYAITDKDTAILKFDNDGYTGWYKWLPYAYLQATGLTVLKKRTATMDKKLVSNTANNSYENTDFDEIYSVATTFLNLSPSQESTMSGKKATTIDVGKLLQDKIAKLDFTAQETVSELVDFIDSNRNMWNHMFGERTNVNKKSDRNISSEFTSDEVHFALMELDQKEQIEEFANDYKKVFGKEITPIFMIDEKLKEIEEQQRALSGGGADREQDSQEEGKDDK